jgi:coenzyme F420 hydrogenase subunit beta
LNQTIETVVNNGLCTGCGTCSGVCSFKAIKMVVNSNGLIEPSIAADCTHCGVCLQVCSGNELDLKKLNSEIFNKQPEN